MNVKKSILYSFFAMVLLVVFCQKEKGCSDSIVFVITNKLCDSLQNKLCNFKNYTDLINPLKYYVFESLNSISNCQQINGIENLNEILNCDKDILLFIHGDGKQLSMRLLEDLQFKIYMM